MDNQIIEYYEGRKRGQKIFKIFVKLAWILSPNFSINPIGCLKNTIFFHQFFSCRRNFPKASTRKRKASFHTLILFLINFFKGSYQDEFDKYFQSAHCFEIAKRVVSKVSLSKARVKFGYTAFNAHNRHMTGYLYRKFKLLTWYGFNLVAVGGTKLRLSRIKAIADHFGVWNP